MKVLYLLLTLFVATSTAQFGGISNLGNRVSNAASNLYNSVQDKVDDISQSIKKHVPAISSNVKNFNEFLNQSGKNYIDAAERSLREGLFKARKSLVDANNAAFESGKVPYELALNAFSDLTDAEFFQRLTGNKRSKKGDEKASEFRKSETNSTKTTKLPNSFDWRDRGGVTDVKYQGDCGSCWSFATTGAIEGHVFGKTGKLPNLSEQNLVDCGNEEFALFGCDGGNQEYGFAFTTHQKGIAKDDIYPYVDKRDQCKYKTQMKGAEINGYSLIKPGDEHSMKAIISQKGPIACSMKVVPSFLQYKRGIYADSECQPKNEDDLNHSVLVVGYGTEKGKDYWIIKNTYDTAWGENGYFKLPRGENFCGISTECSFPIV